MVRTGWLCHILGRIGLKVLQAAIGNGGNPKGGMTEQEVVFQNKFGPGVVRKVKMVVQRGKISRKMEEYQ